MPAFMRSRSPETVSVATGVADFKAVSFATDPVSRQLCKTELWKLWDFEDHAIKCRHCNNPYEVHKQAKTLCLDGHRLAQKVAATIYSKHDATVIYSRTDGLADRRIKVDIPKGYTQVLGLLRAMERSLRHRRQSPILSHDSTYYVPARPVDPAATKPRRSSSPQLLAVRRSNSSRKSSVKLPDAKSRRHSAVVDWPDAELREPSLSSASSSDVSTPPSSPQVETRRPSSMYASPATNVHRASSLRRRPTPAFPPSSYRGPRKEPQPSLIPSLESLSLEEKAQVRVQAERPVYQTAVREPSSQRKSAVFL